MAAKKKSAEVPEADSTSAELSENTGSPQWIDASDHLSQIEAIIAAALAEGDQGDGVFTHLGAIANAVNGARDAQRAWQHQTESPVTSGKARDKAKAAEVAAA